MNNSFEKAVDNAINQSAKFIFISGWKTTKFIVINISKLSYLTVKGLIKEIANIKYNLKYSHYRIVSITSISAIATIITYNTHLKYAPIALPAYLVGRYWIKKAILTIKRKKELMRINRLQRKYKNLLANFEGLNIVEVTKEEITLYNNSYYSVKEIEAKKHIFENHFNRAISMVTRSKRDFRVVTLRFKIETNFKKYYRFDEYINYIDHKKIENMYLPMIMGLDQKGKIHIEDLAVIKHLFISGESGGGKSSLLNCLIQSLMTLTNGTVYVIADLKGGAEMSEYKDFKHTVMLRKIDEFVKMVEELNIIMEKRLDKIYHTKSCKNGRTYNTLYPKKQMTNIVFVIDEIASLKLSTLSESEKKKLENSLLEILQKGRVANMYCIGATQKPSGEQINTNVRAGYLQNISFRVNDKFTEQQTKVSQCKDLKIGEYRSTLDNKIRKAFLILESEQKKEGLPKCNGVFENLERKLLNVEIDFDIKPKREVIDFPVKRNIIQMFLSKINVSRDQKLGHFEDFTKNVLTISSPIMKQVEDLKIKAEIAKNPLGNSDNVLRDSKDSKLTEALLFVYENKAENGKIPETKLIEEKLDISERKRKNILKSAKEKGFLVLKGTQYYIDEKCEKWNNIIIST